VPHCQFYTSTRWRRFHQPIRGPFFFLVLSSSLSFGKAFPGILSSAFVDGETFFCVSFLLRTQELVLPFLLQFPFRGCGGSHWMGVRPFFLFIFAGVISRGFSFSSQGDLLCPTGVGPLGLWRGNLPPPPPMNFCRTFRVFPSHRFFPEPSFPFLSVISLRKVIH